MNAQQPLKIVVTESAQEESREGVQSVPSHSETKMDTFWTQSGAKFVETECDRREVDAEIEALDWHKLCEEPSIPACQGLALAAIIEQIRGEHVAVAWNGLYHNRYSLLGVETYYSNGVGRSYWLDTGSETVCIRSDFEPTQ